jgi:SAM-dependent methyltransferase
MLAGPLFRCLTCDLVFRDPMPDAESLANAYRSIPVGSWSYNEPAHWALSRDAINRLAPNREVLDVGCFRGDFLEFLGPDFQRFGIEPNPDAAAVTRKRGIEIIGESAEQDFSAYRGRFGAIVLMAVVEYLHRPRDVLRELKKLLAPRGLLILFTGDACT